MRDDEIEVPLSRDEQARLAREVRVGGLSFVEIRRRLAAPVEAHIVGLGFQESYRHPAARERVWSALWRFFANEIKPSGSEGLFAAAAEYLNAERMSLLLGHAVQEAALVTADGVCRAIPRARNRSSARSSSLANILRAPCPVRTRGSKTRRRLARWPNSANCSRRDRWQKARPCGLRSSGRSRVADASRRSHAESYSA
jgi:hypothetical protein